ncbi:hypothetical protein IWQ60_006940 [Tieghemiomyces parasiticus]|uniref:F-box domain-containing protein n=1 Tax=Tieghemiomyces parasiticus TaxID=78921 RepID=A0A9W8A438_9FUNG|nr:hypothetical protein IWQ60_006940 [Tieghemiomyces parasiticus]
MANSPPPALDRLACDPLAILPVDVLLNVLDHIPFRERVRCLRVSRCWYGRLTAVPRLWRDAYFTGSLRTRGASAGPTSTTTATPGPSSQSFQRVVQWSGTKLRGLTVAHGDKLAPTALAQLVKTQRPRLERFGLTNARRIEPDLLLRTVVRLSATLTHLSLVGCKVTDASVREILCHCWQLRSLNLSHSTRLSRFMFEQVRIRPPLTDSPVAIKTGTTGRGKRTYQATLSPVRGSTGQPPTAVVHHLPLSPLHPPIQHFIFRDNDECAAPGIWATVCTYYAATLEELDWAHTGDVTLPMLDQLAQCTRLRHLNLSGGKFRGAATPDLEPALLHIAEQCPQLTKVYLARHTELTESHLQCLLGLNTQLTLLDLTAVHCVSNAFLRTFSLHAPNLTHLNLSACFLVEDTGVSHILKRCPQLVYLNVSSTAVTDLIVMRLLRYSRHLRWLWMESCPALSALGIRLMLSPSAFLTRLDVFSLFNCHKVDYETARQVRAVMRPDAQFRFYIPNG